MTEIITIFIFMCIWLAICAEIQPRCDKNKSDKEIYLPSMKTLARINKYKK